ncbi:hypothetical protein RBSWK_06407 [Rhodopirellula baltica SWK14]|uniref:Uncharacterized protein n=1 Tax=Rhodopirellula baltica SWK14 TaxID=993516 RepID=L7C9B7_RHOBT|nr:hypothetical protein RBSWK_06407 [Rhodopirellula baltica SWK14]
MSLTCVPLNALIVRIASGRWLQQFGEVSPNSFHPSTSCLHQPKKIQE